ncbi:MAG TPA: DUF2273 domain-containing protein [Clostridiales bacterium]|nr:DUF2273 domain-containing protein [Clostridiales bacterium]
MNKEKLFRFLIAHPGKIIGVLIGLLFGILVITLGFFKTIFLCICAYIGYFLGNKADKKEDLWKILDQILPFKGK